MLLLLNTRPYPLMSYPLLRDYPPNAGRRARRLHRFFNDALRKVEWRVPQRPRAGFAFRRFPRAPSFRDPAGTAEMFFASALAFLFQRAL